MEISTVVSSRADIEMVAGMLMERGTLTGEEIDAALPPGFMARPVTWALALAEVEDGRDER